MVHRLPPLQALRAFEAAARLGSLTKAAEALSLTHGAISHQIKALESELGVPLTERAGRGIRLTDDGERFAARVRDVLADLADAVREARERSNPRQFRVSVLPSFALRWLLPRSANFRAAHPDIDLDIRSSMALADFRRDDVDCAIRLGGGNYPGLTTEHLFDEDYFPVCSPRFNGGKLPRRPEDLAGVTLLRSPDEYWKPWLEAAGLDWPEPQRGPAFNDSSLILQAAADGLGVALARSSLLANDIRNGVLVRLFDLSVPSPSKIWLVYPPRLAQSPKLLAFRSWLHDELAADPQLRVPSHAAEPRSMPARRRKRN